MSTPVASSNKKLIRDSTNKKPKENSESQCLCADYEDVIDSSMDMLSNERENPDENDHQSS